MEIVKGDASTEDIGRAAVRNKQEKHEFGKVMYRMHQRMDHGAYHMGPMIKDLNIAYTLLLKEVMGLATTKAEGDTIICNYIESTEVITAILKDLRKET